MREKYDNWIKSFMNSWKNLDWKSTLEILDKNVEYYENPIDKPCSNFTEVTNLWNIIEDNQKNIDYNYDIILFDKKFCIVHWQMTRTLLQNNKTQKIDGIFQISLNSDEKCTYFKQWRYVKEN